MNIPVLLNRRRSQSGLTLVEIMVAIVISLILTAGIIQLFLGTSQTYRFQESLSRIQENGRFAMEVMSRDIRMAGYWGCASADLDSVVNTLNDSDEYFWSFGIAIEGYEAIGEDEWSPVLPTVVSSMNPLSGSDILTLRAVQDAGITVTAHPGGNPPGSANIQTNAGNGLQQFDIVMVSDCVSAAVFQITSANPNTSGSLAHNTGVGTPGNATQALGKEYTGGEILRINTNTYYIRQGSNGLPALWRTFWRTSSNSVESQELVEGVERMRVTYGVDTTNNNRVDEYVGVAGMPTITDGAGNVVPDWSTVLSVRIELLLMSLADNITGETQSVIFGGTAFTPDPADNRLRQVFSTTIGVRNRLP